MKTILTKQLIGFLLLTLPGLYVIAQDKKEDIKVQITKEVDGEVITYEKSYGSEEEIKADEDLKAFMGDRGQMPFWFSDEDSGTTVHYNDSLDKSRKYMFRFHGDEDFARHFKGTHPSDSSLKEFKMEMRKLNDHLSGIEVEISEKLKKLHGEGAFAFSFGDRNFDFDFRFPDSLSKEVVKKSVKISEEVGEFGKMGEVKENKQLKLESLSYFPNPSSNGRFKLRFKTPDEGELSIKVYNLGGKEIFNRYFERYSGLFSETIDLSSQSEGMYLLEIQMEGKRLTRKITID